MTDNPVPEHLRGSLAQPSREDVPDGLALLREWEEGQPETTYETLAARHRCSTGLISKRISQALANDPSLVPPQAQRFPTVAARRISPPVPPPQTDSRPAPQMTSRLSLELNATRAVVEAVSQVWENLGPAAAERVLAHAQAFLTDAIESHTPQTEHVEETR